ncbi:MAG: nicotinamide mononucleotide transporter [Candidatus Kariarchaeaceae archaeon]|jgi:nicotinamide riboside transporter PnuC
MHDILGWIGNIFLVSGMISLVHKKVYGFYLCAINNIIYVEVGRQTGTYSLMFISVFLVLINGYGVAKWVRNGGKS